MMKCDWVQQNVLLYIYDELADDARYELEAHINRCVECARELGRVREFHFTMTALPVREPSPMLVESSRTRLGLSLEKTKQNGFWHHLVLEPAAWLRQIRFAPALAAAIFIAGFAGGAGTAYKVVSSNYRVATNNIGGTANAEPIAVPVAESTISGIRSVSQVPGSNLINIQYDTVSAQEAQGSLNDRRIEQLLLFAARNTYNPGVRMDSVDLLTQEPGDANVREALIFALRYDANPGVRVKALEALKPYVKSDVRVRDTMLEALLNDSNPGVRTEALHSVQGVRADSSVRAVLHRLARQDDSKYIRSQARTELAQLPEID
jgi:hypothetical protein